MAETIEALERRIDELRVAVREAVLAGDPAVASTRRGELKRAEQSWEDALAAATVPAAAGPATTGPATTGPVATLPAATLPATGPASAAPQAAGPQALAPAEQAGSLLPLREQVYEALSLLHVPAAPKLNATVHEAFFGSTFPDRKSVV